MSMRANIGFLTVTTLAILAGAGSLVAARQALARQPAAPAPGAQSPRPATPLLIEADALEKAGDREGALLRLLTALALDPEDGPARAALLRVASAPSVRRPAPADEPAPVNLEAVHERLRAEREAREALARDLANLDRRLVAQQRDLSGLQTALDDRARAEPITDRLDRNVMDLERQIERQRLDLASLQRDVDRLESEVSRLASRVR